MFSSKRVPVMRFHICVLWFSILLMFVTACGGSGTSLPDPVVPTQPAQATVVLPTATQFVENPGSVRRAPTIAPTEPPTDIPTQAPTELPTATALPTNTSTPLPVATAVTKVANTRPAATAVPNIAPGVYVTAFRVDPAAPKTKPAEFSFTVNFLNTVGEPVNYPLWRVLILPKGQTKAVGDPRGASKTIATGASQQTTEPWSIRVTSGCETFLAQPVWQDEEGRQIPLNKPDGSSVTLEFQVCP